MCVFNIKWFNWGDMKSISWVIALPLLTSAAYADDATKIDAIEKKVDVIVEKVDTVIEKQDRIYSKLENDPLQGRKYGVELNLFRLLTIRDDYQSISGTVSYFSKAQKAEIAVPFFYSSDQPSDNYSGSRGRFTLFTLDVHYRYFLGDKVDGFYISGFGRFARLHGQTGDDLNWYYDSSQTRPYATENKIGVGVGIGYRIFSKNGIYWGTSLSAGRYIVGKNDKFYHGEIADEDSRTIIDFEFLKYGYAF